MPRHFRLVRKDPEYRLRRRQSEIEVQQFLRRYRGEGLRSGVVRIPVVVHVVYNTSAQNVSDAQINSQIAVLNEDYRRLNADAGSVPSTFAGVAADSRIEFQLAVRDPDCNPTTGITRTSTSETSFSYFGDAVKSASTGGHDPWPRDKYLNLWVCNLAGGLLGYASFPGDPATTDGVVIDFEAFGTTGTAASPFDLGRTATHEVGHWLNLLHIWGDDGNACTGSDNVADTPNQADENYGCPSFPQVSCGNGPNGDMFMNYLDYVDDVCMFMFTADQAARMDATLHTTRNAILASDGLVPPSGGVAADLWSKDNADDDGTEPDPSTGPMYISDDIWVRRQNDGLTNQEHENPEYRPPGSMSNYVYARVRNRACSGSASGTVKLYWAKASSGLSWPSPWDGSVTTPALMGGFIDSQSVTVAGRDDEILTFPWFPPNPADYSSFGADQSHFCLLSRIETSGTPPFGMTTPEGSNLWANVKNNNNIVWKNITVVDELPGGAKVEYTTVANFTDQIMRASLLFVAPRHERPSVFHWGQVLVDLGEKLFEIWKANGSEGAGVKPLDGTTLLIEKSGAFIDNLELDPQALYTIRVQFLPKHRQPLGVHVYSLDVLQQVKCNGRAETIGGQRFVVKILPDPKAQVWDLTTIQFDGVGWSADSGICTCLTKCCS